MPKNWKDRTATQQLARSIVHIAERRAFSALTADEALLREFLGYPSATEERLNAERSKELEQQLAKEGIRGVRGQTCCVETARKNSWTSVICRATNKRYFSEIDIFRIKNCV